MVSGQNCLDVVSLCNCFSKLLNYYIYRPKALFGDALEQTVKHC